MRKRLNPLLVLIGVMILVGLPSTVIAQSARSQTLQARNRSYKAPPRPPQGMSAPGSRASSASRSPESSISQLELQALAPEFKDSELDVKVWGQTIAERPMFLFFIPFTDPKTKLEFSVQTSDGEDVYRTSLTPPSKAGVMPIQLPSGSKLEMNQSYRWTLKARLPVQGSSTSEQVYVQGWIRRVQKPDASSISDEAESLIYAEQGLWYDAIASLAAARSRNPNNPQLKQNWLDLLRSANLEALADKPLLN